jgi:hypothetical protein
MKSAYMNVLDYHGFLLSAHSEVEAWFFGNKEDSSQVKGLCGNIDGRRDSLNEGCPHIYLPE